GRAAAHRARRRRAHPRPRAARAGERHRRSHGGRGLDHRDRSLARREQAGPGTRARCRSRHRCGTGGRAPPRAGADRRAGGRGADVVVEVAAVTTEPVAEALHYAASGARVVLAGVKGFKAVPEFVSDLVVVKELTLIGAFGVTVRGYESAIRLIESGRVPLE